MKEIVVSFILDWWITSNVVPCELTFYFQDINLYNNLFLINYKLAYSESYVDRIFHKYWVAQTMSMTEYLYVFHECGNSIFNLQIVKHKVRWIRMTIRDWNTCFSIVSYQFYFSRNVASKETPCTRNSRCLII